ncbi:CDP-diacylglycerol--glycerol-3-phosphate 3-phosphatidyltransferase, mitochondrial-like [Artemia franciscana]
MAQLNKCLEWIPQVAPCFSIYGGKVKVMSSPKEFYETLLAKSKNAKRRITIASLYLGTGQMERTLVESIRSNIIQHGESLRVKILLDATRGSRGKVNSRKILLPLVKHNCKVSLYHTPSLRGILHWSMPERWNEVIGLQHMKVYLFDNSVIISGANLSEDYFTNRQDRYVLLEDCEELADFYDDLVEIVSTFSFQLDSDDQIHLHSTWTEHPFHGDFNGFVLEARKRIEGLINSRLNPLEGERMLQILDKTESSLSEPTVSDTWIFPLVQMSTFSINQDSRFTTRLFESVPRDSKVKLASGYFNLTEEYIDTIIDRSPASFEILTAHPEANGFLRASGPAGGIPAAYTHIASKFLEKVAGKAQDFRIKLREFRRQGWTFHTKGLWVFRPGNTLPFLTLVGSPNFGYRSVYRDLESQIAVITTNQDLQSSLSEEAENLYRDSQLATKETYEQWERYVPLWVRGVVGVVKHYF